MAGAAISATAVPAARPKKRRRPSLFRLFINPPNSTNQPAVVRLPRHIVAKKCQEQPFWLTWRGFNLALSGGEAGARRGQLLALIALDQRLVEPLVAAIDVVAELDRAIGVDIGGPIEDCLLYTSRCV